MLGVVASAAVLIITDCSGANGPTGFSRGGNVLAAGGRIRMMNAPLLQLLKERCSASTRNTASPSISRGNSLER
jgi:hypothetical protein